MAAGIFGRAASAIRALFSRGGGRGSRIASQNQAARLNKGAAQNKAVRLPAIGTKGAGRSGAKGAGGGGGG